MVWFSAQGTGAYLRQAAYSGQGTYFFFDKEHKTWIQYEPLLKVL